MKQERSHPFNAPPSPLQDPAAAAIVRNLARIYEEVLREPMPADLQRLVARLRSDG